MSDIKKQYDVKVEFLVPTTITYRVAAISEEEALKEAEKTSARAVSTRQKLNRKIKIKATVCQPYSNMVKLSRTYRNI
jgi:hypothetical protein